MTGINSIYEIGRNQPLYKLNYKSNNRFINYAEDFKQNVLGTDNRNNSTANNIKNEKTETSSSINNFNRSEASANENTSPSGIGNSFNDKNSNNYAAFIDKALLDFYNMASDRIRTSENFSNNTAISAYTKMNNIFLFQLPPLIDLYI